MESQPDERPCTWVSLFTEGLTWRGENQDNVVVPLGHKNAFSYEEPSVGGEQNTYMKFCEISFCIHLLPAGVDSTMKEGLGFVALQVSSVLPDWAGMEMSVLRRISSHVVRENLQRK